MTKWQRWRERTQMYLTLELAIVLPAAALIGYSVWHLRSVQRSRGVEAAIQRDFSHVLKIAEKRINRQAYKLVEQIRSEFPGPNDPIGHTLDNIVSGHPEVAHIALYDRDTGCVFRSQPQAMSDPYFRAESERLAPMFDGWMKLEGEAMLKDLRKIEQKDGTPFSFHWTLEPRGEKKVYENFAMMSLPGWPQNHVALGIVVLDSEYLRGHFFPEILNNVLAEDLGDPHGSRTGGNPTVMMVHVKKETARGQEVDKVVGLELGADDYVTKPFSIRELLARVKAVLRRAHTVPREQERFSFGDVDIDLHTHQVRRSGKAIEFSYKEFALLKYFLCHPGETVSRDRLLDEVWGYDRYPTTRTVDVHIVRLRKKLEPNPEEPRFILTVHGIGYKFVG